jgi:hypothetical protein
MLLLSSRGGMWWDVEDYSFSFIEIKRGVVKMKKAFALSAFAVFTLMLSSLVCAQTVVDLIAGGGDGVGTDLGDVTITFDGANITVAMSVDSPWIALGDHVAVGTVDSEGNIDGIPMNKSGNPKVGNFPNKVGDVIPAPAIPEGGSLIVAVHVEIQDPNVIVVPDDPETPDVDETEYLEETAWGAGDSFPGSNWATYIVLEQ